MGLDMNLTAERYLSSFHENDKRIAAAVSELIGIKPESDDFDAFGKVSVVIIKAGYWRKANQIHAWFVENVQDGRDECQDSYVGRDQLQELRRVCEGVLTGELVAADTLPTRSGFFFGSTAYGDEYKQDLRDTIAIVNKALTLPDTWEFYYHASW